MAHNCSPWLRIAAHVKENGMSRVGRVLLRLSESRHVPSTQSHVATLAHIEEIRQR